MAQADKVPAEGLRFECTQCGECCTARGEYAYVYLNAEEVERLADFTGVSIPVFKRERTFRDEEGWRQLRFEGDRCFFLDSETNACSVYEARPIQCRTFPFWNSMIDRGNWSEDALRLCEGLGRGRLYSVEEIHKRMVEMDESEED
ncbi:MAG: YkgJ family cysteine cluster protein [bacterium]|nr:YkgJ family cysteine cluster protein [bacterium]